MTRTTSNQVQRWQASSTPFTVLGLKLLSLHLPAPKIFQVKSLLRKGKLPQTKHRSSNPWEEVSAQGMRLKRPALFWRARSLGNTRAKAGGLCFLPCTQSPAALPAQKCQSSDPLALPPWHWEGETSRLHTTTTGKYNFPLSSTGLNTDKTMMGESFMWLEIRPSQALLTEHFLPAEFLFLKILVHSLRGEYWTATYIKSHPKLHEEGCGGRIYVSISSGNISDRNVRAGKRLFKTAHSVFSRIRINASQRMKGEVKKEDFNNQAWGWCEHHVWKATSCL